MHSLQHGRQQQGVHLSPLCQQLAADAAIAEGTRNPYKSNIVRALEVLYATGAPMSRQTSASPPPWRVLELGLNPLDLRQRISARTQALYSQGLVEETHQLRERYGPELPLLQTIGYGEALQVLAGDLSRPAAIAHTTRRTQQFAKRQRTWFRRQHQPHWLPDDNALNEAGRLIEAGLG